MLGFLKKEKNCEIFSPITKGQVIKLELVPDQVFASKMMGDGVGFINESDKIIAPCDGTVIMTQPSKHAVGIKTKNGAEILIHVGLDTVNLKGEGFVSNIQVGDKINRGDVLISYDSEFMESKSIDMTTPMIIMNGSEYQFNIVTNDDNVNSDSKIIEISKR